MSDFLIFKAAFNNSATPAIGTYTAEGATAQFNNDPDVSPDYYLYNTAASSTAVQWFVPTKETTDFEFVADILTDDQSLGGDRYFIIADSAGTTGLCMLSSSSITEWRFMNGDSTATSDPEYVGAIDPATSGGLGVFHQFRVRVRKLTASSSSVEVYVDGTLRLTATAGAALVTCAKIGFIGGVTGSPSTSAGIKNAYVYDLSGRELVDRGVLSEGFNRLINWAKNDSGFITSEIDSMGTGWVRFKSGIQICYGVVINDNNLGNGIARFSFPKAFNAGPILVASPDDSGKWVITHVVENGATWVLYTFAAWTSPIELNGGALPVHYVAVGKWK